MIKCLTCGSFDVVACTANVIITNHIIAMRV